MTYAYLPGPEQPDSIIQMPKGQAVAGQAIGILVLDLFYPLVPGNVANASSFDFPVMYKVLKGAGSEILKADPAILERVIEGGRELEEQGVRAVIGSCGYFGHYQKEAAAALDLPVFLSSLLQAPIIVQSLKGEQKVGIICAVEEALTPGILEACGINDRSRIVVTGAQDLPEFANILKDTGRFNSRILEQEMAGLASRLVGDHPEVGAILLECSDMPPYAWAIQKAARRPVFDYTTMINWIHNAVVRRPFAGLI